MRLDRALVELELVESRTRAQHLIEAGVVWVNGQKVERKSMQVLSIDNIEVRSNPYPYVSRAGLKLEKALQYFGIDLNSMVVLDIGASTGGFTHAALCLGADKVYAVDVGTDQLHPSLRTDPRVISYENTHVKHLNNSHVSQYVDVVCIDVSFISLGKVLPSITKFLHEKSQVIALVKPQFEVGPRQVSKKGVVSRPETHEDVLKKVYQYGLDSGLFMSKVTHSPYVGDAGNIEFLTLFETMPSPRPNLMVAVCEAHQELR